MFGRSDERFRESLGAIGPPPTWFERVSKKRIVVHLRNDQSIEGVLWEHTLDGVILRAAKLLGNDGKQTPIAGETFVPREQVAFAQIDE